MSRLLKTGRVENWNAPYIDGDQCDQMPGSIDEWIQSADRINWWAFPAYSNWTGKPSIRYPILTSYLQTLSSITCYLWVKLGYGTFQFLTRPVFNSRLQISCERIIKLKINYYRGLVSLPHYEIPGRVRNWNVSYKTSEFWSNWISRGGKSLV